MRRIATSMVAVAVVLFAAGLSAQGKPSFAGKWTLQVDPNAAPPAGGGGGGGRGGGRGGGFGGGFCGMGCDIAQDAGTLTVTREAQGGGTAPAPTVFKLDGSEVKSEQPGRNGGAATTVTTKAAWEGSKLTISTTRDFNGTPNTTKMSVSLDGGSLVVETTAPGRNGGEATTTKQTYKKG